MPCSRPRKRSRLRSLSTSLACRRASWWSGRASALGRGPSCWSLSETARARSSAENSLALRLALSSESGAKKVSVPMEAIRVPQALNWKAGSVAMGIAAPASAAALACKRSRAAFRSSGGGGVPSRGGGGWWGGGGGGGGGGGRAGGGGGDGGGVVFVVFFFFFFL